MSNIPPIAAIQAFSTSPLYRVGAPSYDTDLLLIQSISELADRSQIRTTGVSGVTAQIAEVDFTLSISVSGYAKSRAGLTNRHPGEALSADVLEWFWKNDDDNHHRVTPEVDGIILYHRPRWLYEPGRLPRCDFVLDLEFLSSDEGDDPDPYMMFMSGPSVSSIGGGSASGGAIISPEGENDTSFFKAALVYWKSTTTASKGFHFIATDAVQWNTNSLFASGNPQAPTWHGNPRAEHFGDALAGDEDISVIGVYDMFSQVWLIGSAAAVGSEGFTPVPPYGEGEDVWFVHRNTDGGQLCIAGNIASASAVADIVVAPAAPIPATWDIIYRGNMPLGSRIVTSAESLDEKAIPDYFFPQRTF